MNFKSINRSILLLFCLVSSVLRAQSSINSSGGSILTSNGKYNFSFSLGQVAVAKRDTLHSFESQGVQQSYEITELLSVKDLKNEYKIHIFPNPTTDVIILKIQEERFNELQYNLIDLNGKLIKSSKLISNETVIDFKETAASSYFLSVFDGNKEVKTFKIIKN
jgi:hypothetical protein